MLPNTCFMASAVVASLCSKTISPASLQDAGGTGAISQIQTNGELPLENLFLTRPHSANLLHCRSPFLCASSTSNIGSLTHPAGDRPKLSKRQTKELIPAGKIFDVTIALVPLDANLKLVGWEELRELRENGSALVHLLPPEQAGKQ
jgi:hypothetical protein